MKTSFSLCLLLFVLTGAFLAPQTYAAAKVANNEIALDHVVTVSVTGEIAGEPFEMALTGIGPETLEMRAPHKDATFNLSCYHLVMRDGKYSFVLRFSGYETEPDKETGRFTSICEYEGELFCNPDSGFQLMKSPGFSFYLTIGPAAAFMPAELTAK